MHPKTIDYYKQVIAQISLNESQEKDLVDRTIAFVLKYRPFTTEEHNSAIAFLKLSPFKKHLQEFMTNNFETLNKDSMEIAVNAMPFKALEAVIQDTKAKANEKFAELYNIALTERLLKDEAAKNKAASELVSVFGECPMSNAKVMVKMKLKAHLSDIFYKVVTEQNFDTLVNGKFRGSIDEHQISNCSEETFEKILKYNVPFFPSHQYITAIITTGRGEWFVNAVHSAYQDRTNQSSQWKSYYSRMIGAIQSRLTEYGRQGPNLLKHNGINTDEMLLHMYDINKTAALGIANIGGNPILKTLRKL